MESIKTLIDKEFQYTQQAMQMIVDSKKWTPEEMIKFTELSKEISNLRKKLSTNPNFHQNGNGLMN